jgi:Putative Ig domain
MEMKILINLRRGRLLGVLAVAAALVGCGGNSSPAVSTNSSTPAAISSAFNPAATSTVQSSAASVSQPPTGQGTTISGVAATTAKVGQPYSFQPSATGKNNATLTFAVSGAPRWATFSASTGRLSGTPTSADVGMTQNIIEQVTDGNSTAALAAFSITVAAIGGSVGSANLSWQAPTENTDGSTLSNLGGYVIHYGTASKNYSTSITLSNPGLTSYVVEDLPAGTYYFSMTATTTSGTQSGASAEASLTIS